MGFAYILIVWVLGVFDGLDMRCDRKKGYRIFLNFRLSYRVGEVMMRVN